MVHRNVEAVKEAVLPQQSQAAVLKRRAKPNIAIKRECDFPLSRELPNVNRHIFKVRQLRRVARAGECVYLFVWNADSERCCQRSGEYAGVRTLINQRERIHGLVVPRQSDHEDGPGTTFAIGKSRGRFGSKTYIRKLHYRTSEPTGGTFVMIGFSSPFCFAAASASPMVLAVATIFNPSGDSAIQSPTGAFFRTSERSMGAIGVIGGLSIQIITVPCARVTAENTVVG